MQYNKFYGTLPDLSKMTNLQHANFVGNARLTGTVSQAVCTKIGDLQTEGTKISNPCDACGMDDTLPCATYEHLHTCSACGNSNGMVRCHWDDAIGCLEREPTCECEAMEKGDCGNAWWCKWQVKSSFCHFEAEEGSCTESGYVY